MGEKTIIPGKPVGLDRISKFCKTGVRMDINKSTEIEFAMVCSFAWGTLVATAFAKFFANVSGYPSWSITGVFIAVSIIGFVITVCAFIVDVETG